MEVNVRQIYGGWDLGYSLDKHTISSTPIGHNEWGHMQFDTIRPEASANLIIPMPASRQRSRQPVIEIARELSRLMNIP